MAGYRSKAMSEEVLDIIGTMIVDSRGRVGQICNVYTRSCRVQYGVDGPYATLPKKQLRVASIQEILDADMSDMVQVPLPWGIDP